MRLRAVQAQRSGGYTERKRLRTRSARNTFVEEGTVGYSEARPLEVASADQGTCEPKERKMEVSPAFIPDGEPAEAADPRERALDPPAVPAKTLTRLHPFACDSASDPPVV